MIANDLAFKLEGKQWFLVSPTERYGPYANGAAAIKARQDKAETDVAATVEAISRKHEARRQQEEAGL
jgi:hypothetical protein